MAVCCLLYAGALLVWSACGTRHAPTACLAFIASYEWSVACTIASLHRPFYRLAGSQSFAAACVHTRCRLRLQLDVQHSDNMHDARHSSPCNMHATACTDALAAHARVLPAADGRSRSLVDMKALTGTSTLPPCPAWGAGRLGGPSGRRAVTQHDSRVGRAVACGAAHARDQVLVGLLETATHRSPYDIATATHLSSGSLRVGPPCYSCRTLILIIWAVSATPLPIPYRSACSTGD